MRYLFLFLASLCLLACQTATLSSPSAYYLTQTVEGKLPTLALSPTFSAQQLLDIRYQNANKHSQVLVLLEQSPQMLKLTVLSPVGIKLAQLAYDGEKTTILQQLPTLGDQLPLLNQIVGDILLTTLPTQAWQDVLPQGWDLQQHAGVRYLRDPQQRAVIEIHYLDEKSLDKKSQDKQNKNTLQINHLLFDYQIRIQALSNEGRG